ncbi:MAG: type VII secretion protein EccC, partial [Thermocrispum sp.]
MSTVQFKRSPRMPAPRTPGGEVHLEPPPEIPRNIPGSVVQKVLPFVMILAMLGMVAFMFTAMKGQGRGVNPMFLMMPIMMMVSMGGMFMGGGRGGGQKKAEMNEDRKDYLRYLGQMRERAHEAMREQHAALEWVHPHPSTLTSIATSRRMWERRTNDKDFMHLRVGLSSHRLATRLVPPQTGPVDELEPVATLALRRFTRANSLVRDLPTQISIRGFAAVSINGER